MLADAKCLSIWMDPRRLKGPGLGITLARCNNPSTKKKRGKKAAPTMPPLGDSGWCSCPFHSNQARPKASSLLSSRPLTMRRGQPGFIATSCEYLNHSACLLHLILSELLLSFWGWPYPSDVMYLRCLSRTTAVANSPLLTRWLRGIYLSMQIRKTLGGVTADV